MLIIKRNDAFDKATAATQRQSARTRTKSNEQKHQKKKHYSTSTLNTGINVLRARDHVHCLNNFFTVALKN